MKIGNPELKCVASASKMSSPAWDGEKLTIGGKPKGAMAGTRVPNLRQPYHVLDDVMTSVLAEGTALLCEADSKQRHRPSSWVSRWQCLLDHRGGLRYGRRACSRG